MKLAGFVLVQVALVSCTRSQTYRYIEEYSPSFLGNLTDWEREFVALQEIEDRLNDLFTPDADRPGQPVMEYSEIGLLDLGDIIYRGRGSLIYEVYNKPGMLVKYQANCDEIRNGTKAIHPLIFDYRFMRESFNLGLSPEPIFLSPPALLGVVVTLDDNRKYSFDLTEDEIMECLMNGGTVRYMIMQSVSGQSVYQYRQLFDNWILPMPLAAKLTQKILNALAILHEQAKIIHGDIHSGNIMLEQDGDSDIRVFLIDFGRARRDDKSMTNDRIVPVGHWFHQLCSPWQIDGRSLARRDDIYRTIHLFAALINPMQFTVREDMFLKHHGPELSVAIKRNTFMFLMAPPFIFGDRLFGNTFNPLTNAVGYDQDKLPLLIRTLQEIQLNITAPLDDINARIPYEKLVQGFESVIEIVR